MNRQSIPPFILAFLIIISLSGVYLVAQVPPDRLAAFHTDIEYFRGTAAAVIEGQIPYIDFELQYPPLVLLPALTPHVLTLTFGGPMEPSLYYAVFAAAMVVVLGLAGYLTIKLAERIPGASPISAAATFAGTVLLLMLVLPWRYEAFPVALGAGALLLFIAGHASATGAVLASAVVAKLYPVVWGPVALLDRRLWHGRALAGFLVGGTAVVAVVLSPFIVFDATAPLRMFGEQFDRGLQVESTLGSLVLAADSLGLIQALVDHRPDGAWEVSGQLADLFLRLQPLAFAAAYGLVIVTAWRTLGAGGADRPVVLNALFGAAVLAFILTNKVLSPQHIAWLLPFAAVGPRPMQVGVVLAAGLTTLVYPILYRSLLDGELLALSLVMARNAVLLLLFLAMVQVSWKTHRDEPQSVVRQHSAS